MVIGIIAVGGAAHLADPSELIVQVHPVTDHGNRPNNRVLSTPTTSGSIIKLYTHILLTRC